MSKQARRLTTIALVGVITIAGAALARRLVLTHNQPTPEFAGTQLNGETWSLTDYRGKGPLIVSFGATWCMPCRLELPHLERLYAKYRARGLNIVIVGNEDQPTLRADGLFGQTAIPVLYDAAPVHLAYRVDGLPRTLVFAPDGELAGVYKFYNEAAMNEIDRYLTAVLGE